MNRVEDIDKGWDRIRRETEALGDKMVKVGIQSDAGAYSDDDDEDAPTLVEIAFWNEYGTEGGASGGGWGGPVPERPFMRNSFDDNKSDLQDFKGRLWDRVIRGTVDARQAAELLGQRHEGQVKETITSLATPPNAPATIALKGSSNPLIDSGQMRQSVRYEVE